MQRAPGFLDSCSGLNVIIYNQNLVTPPKGGKVQSIAFCSRCRGMKVGWNARYILHCMSCKEWMSKSSKLLILTIVLSVLVLGFPTPSAFVFSGPGAVHAIEEAGLQIPVALSSSPAVTAIESFLRKNDVDESHQNRVARAIV